MGPKAGAPPPDYLREIERAFVARRGGAPFLSPADWELASRWESSGIPLDVVISGIHHAFASGRPDRRASLRTCSAAVESAWSRHRRAATGSGKVRPQLAGHLREWTPPENLPSGSRERLLHQVERAAARLRAGEPPRTVLDALLVACIEALPPERREALAAEATRAVEGYRSRMPAQAFGNLVRDATRRHAARFLRFPFA